MFYTFPICIFHIYHSLQSFTYKWTTCIYYLLWFYFSITKINIQVYLVSWIIMWPLKSIVTFTLEKIIQACSKCTTSATTIFILQIKFFSLLVFKRSNISEKLNFPSFLNLDLKERYKFFFIKFVRSTHVYISMLAHLVKHLTELAYI